MLFIASDHRGFNLKNELINYFKANSVEYEDLGPYQYVQNDNYTEYTLKLVERVRANEGSFGVLACRNGVGVSMLANKFKGIRATLSFTPEHAASSKTDDNTNVLALPAEFIDTTQSLEIFKSWFATPFSNADRHINRLKEEEKYGQE